MTDLKIEQTGKNEVTRKLTLDGARIKATNNYAESFEKARHDKRIFGKYAGQIKLVRSTPSEVMTEALRTIENTNNCWIADGARGEQHRVLDEFWNSATGRAMRNNMSLKDGK